MQLSPGWRVAPPKVGSSGWLPWALGRGITSGQQGPVWGICPSVPLGFCPVSRGKVILGYTETELCRGGSGYQFVHVADVMYCAENHVRSEYRVEGGASRRARSWGPL